MGGKEWKKKGIEGKRRGRKDGEEKGGEKKAGERRKEKVEEGKRKGGEDGERLCNSVVVVPLKSLGLEPSFSLTQMNAPAGSIHSLKFFWKLVYSHNC